MSMKRRLLALVLVLVMVLNWVPVSAAARSSAAADNSQSSGVRPGQSASSDSLKQNLGFAPNGETGLTKFEPSDVIRFSENEKFERIEPDDLVTFIVVLDGQPLLEKFSAKQIGQQSDVVVQALREQELQVNRVQQKVLANFGQEDGFKMGFTYSMATVGFSVTTAYRNMDALRKLQGVKSVYVAPTFEVPVTTQNDLSPMTSNSSTMIGANILNELGYTGKGQRIAILDTGITVDHPSFAALPDDVLVDPMTRDSVNEVWNELNAGKMANSLNLSYYNSKLPFIFNYVAGNFNVAHSFAGSDHGTHVAGIAAANRTETTEVIGMAPEAQLVVMQVFQQGGGAGWDTIMAALEDCVLLEVDTVNLSLGMAAGFHDSEGDMLDALALFLDTDIQVLIASGNDTNNAYMNLWGLDMSLIGNPDIGLAGTPSTYSAALAVASVDNDGYEQYYITVNGVDFGFQDTATARETVFLNVFRNKDVEYVMVPGVGAEEDYEGLDVTGKIAVVSRGTTSFAEKQAMAQEKGAVGCIIYNNDRGPFAMQVNDGNGAIPAISVTREAGAALREAAGEDGVGTLKVCNADMKVFKVEQTVSAFSSWGVTPDLKLKPEISGVGGSIYSAVDPEISGSYYGYMSGTSMATPQVAGAMAVLLQYLDENFPEITGAEQRVMAANLMMSTANPLMATDTLEYSPRAQGAGLVDLLKATTTPAYLSNPAASEGRPKVEFGDDPEKTGVYEFSFTITNISDETVSYTFDSSVLTETIYGGMFIANSPYGLEAKVEMPELVEVPAGETVTVNAKLVLTEADKAYLEQFPNGIYVEGYVYANPVAEDGVTLAMPMVGFYGDWSDAPVFDDRDPNMASLYPRVVFTYSSQLGANPYFRNGKAGSQYSAFSYKNPLAEIDFGMLRNAKYMYISVVNKENPDEVYYEIDGVDLAKTYFNPNYGMIIPFYLMVEYGEVWDGTDANGKYLPDGTTVTYRFDAWLDDGDDIMDDSWSFDATLDNLAPELLNEDTLQENLRVDAESGRSFLTLEMLDNQYIAALLFVAPDGNIMGKYEIDNTPGEKITGEYEITGFGNEFSIIVADYACNETEIEVLLDMGGQSDGIPEPSELDKDRIYGCETFTGAALEGGWFSANKSDFSDAKNETYNSAGRYYAAEYVNGYLIAQSYITGHLELVIPNGGYWTSKVLVENRGSMGDPEVWSLYDMALDHSGTLSAAYGVDWETDATDALLAVGWMYKGDNDNDGKDDGYNALFNIKFTSYGDVNVQVIAPLTGSSGEILTLGITTEGKPYALDTNGILYSVGTSLEWDENYGQYGENVIKCTEIGVTDFVNYPNYGGVNVVQSMGYDHNTGKMYWFAHSQIPNGAYYADINMTYEIDLETGKCTEVGTYGAGGQTCLFVPNDLESDLFTLGAEPKNMSIVPSNLYLVEGQSERLKIEWTPWNATPAEVTWASLDESVITIDEYGVVTAVSAGTARVTASADMMLDGYWDTSSGDWVWVEPGPGTKTVECVVTVLPSEDALYGYVVEDYGAPLNNLSWVTYSDKDLRDITVIGKQLITVQDQEGNDMQTEPLWAGGTYYNGYVYTTVSAQWTEDNVVYNGTQLYRSKVTPGATPAETTIGEPELVGVQKDMLVSALAFDYNTGRMYCVENQFIGGLGIIDLETGEVDMLGQPNGDLSGAVYIPGLCVTRDGTIVISDAVANLYTIDPDTLTTKLIHQGDGSPYTAFYEAMFYDYNTDSIYWNMCDGNGYSPLYLVILPEYEWEPATVIDMGGISTKNSVQQTILFSIPENEPETNVLPVESIEITNGDSITGLKGGSIKLDTATVPARPTIQKKTWTSSDESVVTVDEFGNITYVGLGTATVTVSITNRDEETYGGPFTDSITVTVLEAAGEFVAFLNSDEGGTGYFDFWLNGNDYDLRHTAVGKSVISIYTLRVGTYYDGYFYGYTDKGQFLRIDAKNPINYKVLGNANLDYGKYQVSGMAMDYTTGTMYALTMPSNYDYNTWSSEQHPGELVTIDLDTGLLTTLATMDFNTPVFALACDDEGQLYAAGGTFDLYATSSNIYKVDKQSGALELYTTVNGARVLTGPTYFGNVQYNAQMTYDWTTDRLYLYATADHQDRSQSFGMYMVQLGDEPTAAYLDSISLDLGRDLKYGDVYLGLLAFIPEADELPVGEVNGIILNKTSGRVGVGETSQLVAEVRPSNAADASLTWTSSDPTVATVDENGVVTGVSEGTAIITVTSNQTGVTATCLITVTNIGGAQNMAYTVSAELGALISFNPAMPAQTAQVLAKLDGGSNIKGMAYGDNCLYYLTSENWAFNLYRFDFDTMRTTFMGQLSMFSEPSGLAYDAENNMFYATSGFYVFQYDGDTLDPANFNNYTNYVMDVDYCTLVGVAVVDGALYTFGNGYYNSQAQMMKYTDTYYFSDRTVVLQGYDVTLVSGATDVAYDAGSGLFYFADAGHTIYAMDMEGNVVTVDILGDGLDLNGFAIDPTAKFQITYTDGVEGETVFADQFYFAAEGSETPLFIGTPSRTGYTFAGWSPVVSDTVTGETVYTATWTANTYTITFDVSGGVLEDKTMEVTYGAPVGELPVPTRSGYTFEGWVDRAGNVYTAETIYTVVGDTFLIAVWTPNAYLMGDVNGDGVVDSTDAKLIMQYDLGMIGANDLVMVAADVNGDGLIDTTDAKLIMKYDLGMITKFPVED